MTVAEVEDLLLQACAEPARNSLLQDLDVLDAVILLMSRTLGPGRVAVLLEAHVGHLRADEEALRAAAERTVAAGSKGLAELLAEAGGQPTPPAEK